MSAPIYRPALVFKFGAFYLTIQALGAAIWWLMLWKIPASRVWFRPLHAPDETLISFLAPDLVFFIGAALWAALMLWRAPHRALLPLALHVGGAGYAALYCLQQYLATGEAALAALFMAPSLVIGPILLWICSRD